MYKTLTIFLLAFASISLAQQTKVDSADAKIEKYYNVKISDSLRAVYKSQIDHMNKYIAQDSVNPKAFLQRGIYYAQLGLNVEAISDYDKALMLNDKEPIAYFNRGLAKARFRYSYDACYDFKIANKLGLQQAADVFNDNCGLFKAKIEQEVAAN